MVVALRAIPSPLHPCPPLQYPCPLVASQLFLRACRRYVETWDSKKMQAQRAAREQEHTTERAVRRQVEGPTLAEEFGAPAAAASLWCCRCLAQPWVSSQTCRCCASAAKLIACIPILSTRQILVVITYLRPATSCHPAAAAAKGGGQALKPFLASLYQTRAEAYRDAVQQFVGGYKQGFQQAMRPQVPPDVVGEMAAGGKAAAAETGGAVAADAGTAHLAPAQATTSSSSSSTTAAADEPAGTAQAQREGLHSTAAEQAGPSASQQLPEPPDEAPGQQQEQQPAGSSKPPAVGAGPAA